jgi:hypothetical protein
MTYTNNIKQQYALKNGTISQRCDRHFDKRGSHEGKRKPSIRRRKVSHNFDRRLMYEASFTSDESVFDDTDDDFVSVVSDSWDTNLTDDLVLLENDEDYHYEFHPNSKRPFPLNFKTTRRPYWMVGNRLSLDTFRLVKTSELFYMFFGVSMLFMNDRFEIYQNSTFAYITDYLNILFEEFQEQKQFYIGLASSVKEKHSTFIPHWLRRKPFLEEQNKNNLFEHIQEIGVPISKYEIQYLYKCIFGNYKDAFLLFIIDRMKEIRKNAIIDILGCAFKKCGKGGHYEMYDYITKFM